MVNFTLKYRFLMHKLKHLYFILLLFSFTNSLLSQIIIEDSVFTKTLDMQGASWDNAIIKNCTFQNTILSDGLRIANVHHVTIENCLFYNIQGNGIRLHPNGNSDGVIIKNCKFDSIYGNGILADEQHRNTQILNNQFNWIGLDTLSNLKGAPHHGIYFTGSNFLISGNSIQNIYNLNGNCISVRSNGIIQNNRLSNATKNGISYFSDHPSVENRLLIENNIVDNCQRGVSIVDGGKQMVDSTIIRFNTLISDNFMNISIGPGLQMNIDIYGNIFVRKDNSSIYVWGESSFNAFTNLTSHGDIGFVDFINHNYHLLSSSEAYGFVTGLDQFPQTDFEGDFRFSLRLDAGADQFTAVSGLLKMDVNDIFVYPNPATSNLNVVTPNNENVYIEISNLVGELMCSAYSPDFIDLSHFDKGVYTITVIQGQRSYSKKFVKY
jgi:hypothetical protein